MHLRKVTAAVTLTSASAVAADCDYASSHNCINAQTSTSVALPIPTLFPSSSSPSFVFAIDDLSHAEILAITSSNKDVHVPSAAAADGPMQAVSWWLDFRNATANTTASQERAYSAWALESNATGEVGGADGGCEGLLGKDCVADLKELFTEKGTLQMGSAVGTGALSKFFAKPPTGLRCPDVLWGDGSGQDMKLGTSDTRPLVSNSNWIARISDHFAISQAPIPGNASFTHGRTAMRFRSLEAQSKLAVVAFSLAYPSGGPGERDENTLNMACLRIGKADKSSDGGDDKSGGGSSGGSGGKDDKGNGAGALSAGVALVAATVMALFTI